ncbi:MAG: PorT family protein [Bacteroidota bacterium]|nr:PorT family protein [Bacteroidota bacterium]
MPVNDFEKQVQQKMDELQFAPSAAVWQQVEARIAPRRRRRLFFLLPLLVLVAGAGWWWIGIHSNSQPGIAEAEKPAAVVNSEQPSVNSLSSNNQRSTTNEKKEESSSRMQPYPEKVLPQAGRKENEVPPVITKKSQRTASVAGKYAPFKSVHESENHRKKRMREGAARRPLQNRMLPSAVHDEAVAVAENRDEPSGGLNESPGEETALHGYVFPFGVDQMAGIVVPEPVNQQPGVPLAPTKKKSTLNKVQWGIEADGGWTNTLSNFPGGIGRTPVFNGNLVFASNNVGSGAFGGNNAAAASSDLRPSGGYSLGILAKINLNRRFSIIAGLRYSRYAASLSTGSRVDSATIQTFRTGTQFSFTNVYRMLEVPISLEHALGHSGRWKGSAGLVAGWVVSDHTLHYNITGGNYKDASSTQQRFQYGIELGLRYQPVQHVPALQIGPLFRYGLSKLSAQSYDGGQHLFFGGISIRYWPGKK